MLADHSGFFDQTRGLVVALSAAIGVDQSIDVVAQVVPSLNDSLVMKVAQEGGLAIVLLVVLFFYRRDYHRLTNSEAESRKEALAAVAKQSEAELKMAVALAQNTDMIRHFLAKQNGEYYSERREEDRRHEEQRREDERRHNERRHS